ncbi:SMP-30/gluconolactonase/LRE family protein [Nocardioides immobilis]|uniref:SMP-30/gluconolactonase/LRE family protein n=1 Tax=Nocardioides immobilis TaxID=2049295 RepID=A0A417XTK5_9ACTN|nr:SMP-30/gluconolactonase/LRE family protein [Nocardioides immobilis]
MKGQHVTITSEWTPREGERYVLGEGPRFVDGQPLIVDILSGRLIDSDSGRTLIQIDEPLGAVAPLTGRNGWIAAAGTGIALIDPDGVEWLAKPEVSADTPMRMNDGVADPMGRFWAGSMAYDNRPGAGSLYRVGVDRTVDRVLNDLTVPNGPAFSNDGSVMYLADSARGVIFRFDVDTTLGDLGPAVEWVRVEGGSPDGMCVDENDHLWSAVWGGSRIDRYAPDGTRTASVPVPVTQPTAVLITPDKRILVTSASFGFDQPQVDDGAVFVAETTVAAAPAARYGPSN